MAVEASPGETIEREGWRAWLAWLRPLRSASVGEIGALDGLRAVAALSVLLYHTLTTLQVHSALFGQDVTFLWFYAESGVELFFVLSGFLLFLPFARAMLRQRPLPSTREFYRRRALRILPAYWVCLGILVLIDLPHYLNFDGLQNVLWHVALLHDIMPSYNRAIEGPMWTLAVEVQFYLLLPLIAWLIARGVGTTRSAARLVGGVLGVIAVALAWRAVNPLFVGWLPTLPDGPHTAINLFLEVTYGSQGKYLEVFAVGMLCAALYVAGTEGRISATLLRRIGPWLAVLALAVYLLDAPRVSIRRNAILALCNLCGTPGDVESLFGPLVLAIGYGALLLAVLWGSGWLRRLFESGALRFIGALSFSMYLWHLPILQAVIPPLAALPVPLAGLLAALVAFAAILLVAYASYQFVERPFLMRRHRQPPATPAPAAPAAEVSVASP